MKRTTKNLGLVALAAVTLSTSSCKKKGCTDSTASNYSEKAKKDDGSCLYTSDKTNNEVVQGSITTNTTWNKQTVYELKGKVVVENNATLTIEAGTIIKGQEGAGTNSSALIIARNAKINAIGTATEPIIFTSILDNIELGQTSGTNLDENDNGKWGGLILLGNAPISAADGDTETQIEGIPATDSYGTFGGNNASDNSGTLNYISIRHGGTLLGAGNEINGLTLGGVGNGTTIKNIEIVANLDDGIEFFGGTVNVTNLVVAFQGDDGIDIDMNYSGTINNFAVVHGIDTDEALEIDGPEGITNTNGKFTLTNGTIKTIDGIGTGADLKSKAQGTLSNVSWKGYTNKVIKIRASFSDTINCTEKKDAYNYLSLAVPLLTISNSEIVSSSSTLAETIDVYTTSVENSANDNCTGTLETNATSIISNDGTAVVQSSSIGATISDFAWTWTSRKNKL